MDTGNFLTELSIDLTHADLFYPITKARHYNKYTQAIHHLLVKGAIQPVSDDHLFSKSTRTRSHTSLVPGKQLAFYPQID